MIDKKLLLLSLADNYNWNFEANISKPLAQVFSKILIYHNYRDKMKLIGFNKLQEELIDYARNFKPHYILIPTSNFEISEETLSFFKTQNSKIVFWGFDDAIRFENYSKWWIPYGDYFLTEDKDTVNKFKNLGAIGFHIPSAANPDIYYKKDLKDVYDVSFVGKDISNRKFYIDFLRANNIKIKTFGFNTNEIITFDEMLDTFSQTKINLNFTGSYLDSNIKQLKARIFEITMCGGFLITEYFEDLEQYFEINKEIVCFHSPEDLLVKIRYYLQNEFLRKKIAKEGTLRSHNNHTWFNRLDHVFHLIENQNYTPQNIDKTFLLLNPSKEIKRKKSFYHYYLAKEWLIKKNTILFKESLKTSLSYNRLNIRVLLLYSIIISPFLGQLIYSKALKLFFGWTNKRNI